METAAAKAGFGRVTGYRLEADARLSSAKRRRRGSRRPDSLEQAVRARSGAAARAESGLRVVATTLGQGVAGAEDQTRRYEALCGTTPTRQPKAGLRPSDVDDQVASSVGRHAIERSHS